MAENKYRFSNIPGRLAEESDFKNGNFLAIDCGDGTHPLPAELFPLVKIIDRGEATVAYINALVFKQDGWKYIVSDSGTLSAGSLAVVAGDCVRWNASQSKWEFWNNYATEENFEKFIYRKEGANREPVLFKSGYFVSKTDGSLVAYGNSYYTELVDITTDKEFCINAKTAALTCIVAVYDENETFIESLGKGSSEVIWNDVVVDSAAIKRQHPTAKYLRFGSFNKKDSYVFSMDYVYNSDQAFHVIEEKIVDNKIEATAKTTGTLGTDYAVTDGVFLGYATGEERSSSNCQCSDFIDISDITCFNVIGESRYDVAIICLYDGNKSFITSFGHETGETVVWTNRKIFVEKLTTDYPLLKYVRFSSIITPLSVRTFTPYSIDDVYDELNGKIEGLENTKYGSYVDTEIEHLETAGFIDKRNGNFTAYNGTASTDFVDLETYRGKILSVTGKANYNVCIFAVYDANQNFIAAYGKSDDSVAVIWSAHKIDVTELLDTNPSIRYARFSSFINSSSGRLEIFEFHPFNTDDLVDDVLKCNSLYGKKWVACGDSFTHGGNVAVDPVTGLHKSYPYWIATRNKMNLVMMAKSGETIHNRDDNTNEFTPTRYLSIPSDADIITLSWGLNETGVTIGDSSSSDDTTLWGAFNEVISFILTNNPKCKIGIIIQDGWMTSTIADAEKAIGAYWGIPVLDLKFDNSVPLGIGGRTGVSSSAASARNGAFQDETNHPNEDAHKYRSTFIESWMRTL